MIYSGGDFSFCRGDIENELYAIAAAISYDRARHWLGRHLATLIEIAQPLLRHLTDMIDQPGKLSIARDNEFKRNAMALGTFRQVGKATAVPLIIDVGYCTFHCSLLMIHILLGP